MCDAALCFQIRLNLYETHSIVVYKAGVYFHCQNRGIIGEKVLNGLGVLTCAQFLILSSKPFEQQVEVAVDPYKGSEQRTPSSFYRLRKSGCVRMMSRTVVVPTFCQFGPRKKVAEFSRKLHQRI